MVLGRLFLVVPLIFSMVSFILAAICLFAGKQAGQLEDYHIIAINMSDFGRNLIPTPTVTALGGSTATATSTSTTTGGGGLGGLFTSIVGPAESAASSAVAPLKSAISSAVAPVESAAASAVSSALGKLSGLGNDLIANELASELGISEWYSLHVTDACQGSFAPNATSPGAWYNVTDCTDSGAGYQFNITAVLDHQLQIGPLNVNLASFGFPKAIQDVIDLLNSFLTAIFVFYVLSMAFTGLSMLLTLSSFFADPARPHKRSLLNGGVAWLAMLMLLVASAIVTAISKKGVNTINDAGTDIGISAVAGTKIMILSWVAFGLMFLVAIFWPYQWWTARKNAKGLTEKPRKHSRESKESR